MAEEGNISICVLRSFILPKLVSGENPTYLLTTKDEVREGV